MKKLLSIDTFILLVEVEIIWDYKIIRVHQDVC